VVGGKGDVKAGRRQYQYLLPRHPLCLAELSAFGAESIAARLEYELHCPAFIALVDHSTSRRRPATQYIPDYFFYPTGCPVFPAIFIQK
jgi:hypothetical protein